MVIVAANTVVITVATYQVLQYKSIFILEQVKKDSVDYGKLEVIYRLLLLAYCGILHKNSFATTVQIEKCDYVQACSSQCSRLFLVSECYGQLKEL